MKKFLILHISLVFVTFILKGQSIEQTLAFADKQFEESNYNNAIKTYERVIFFNNSNNFSIFFKLAECYANTKNYSKAHHYFDVSYNLSDNDSMSNAIIFNKASLYILSGENNLAFIELLSLDDSLGEFQEWQKEFYFGITFFQKEEFDKSKIHFFKAIDTNNISQKEAINQLFIDNYKLKRFNPKLMKYMSVFAPGSGQLYCGDVKNALNSFVLTVSFAALFIYTVHNYSYIDAFISVMPWYQRYYSGGFMKAEEIAENKIIKERNIIFKKILDVVAFEEVP